MENINFILAGLFVLLFGFAFFNDQPPPLNQLLYQNNTTTTTEQFAPSYPIELPYYIPLKPETPQDPQKQVIGAKADPRHADIPTSIGQGKVHPTVKDNWQQVADATGESFYLDPTTGCDVYV